MCCMRSASARSPVSSSSSAWRWWPPLACISPSSMPSPTSRLHSRRAVVGGDHADHGRLWRRLPVTMFGKMIAGLTAVIGLIMLALPVGLIATGFAEDIHRREFVVTWSMVARVPALRQPRRRPDWRNHRTISGPSRRKAVPSSCAGVRRARPCISLRRGGRSSCRMAAASRRGAFFGEMAIVRSTPGAATRRCAPSSTPTARARCRRLSRVDGAASGNRPTRQRGVERARAPPCRTAAGNRQATG